jgi:hypothetical protein
MDISTAQETFPDWKPLKEYDYSELYQLISNNEKLSPHVLAYICSEILRRKMDEEFKPRSCSDE